jgi:tetratricopeptide (TPR) repeat protein
MIQRSSQQRYIFWVHSRTRARFEEAYRGIADRLKLPGRSDPGANILQLVFNWLSNDENGRWVIVLDNVDDGRVFFPDASIPQLHGDGSTPLATYLPQSANGCILLTSRNKDVAYRLTGHVNNVQEVKSMDTELGVQLFCNKLGIQDHPHAIALVQALEGIPLAITQATAYITQRTITVQMYLDRLQENGEKKARLLLNDAGDLRRDASASHSVITTWQISFEHIRTIRPSAADLLSLMSLFNSQGIPQWILRKSKPSYSDSRVGDIEFEDDIEMLKAFCLISETTEKLIALHALVQYSTRFWLNMFGTTHKWERTFLVLMNQEFPDGTYQQWTLGQELFPHVARLHEAEPIEDLLENWASLLTNVACYVHQRGDNTMARHIAEKTVETKQRLFGDSSLSTLRSQETLGLIIRAQGDYDMAESLLLAVFNGRRKELGVRNSSTLRGQANLAAISYDRGNYKEAEEMYQKVLRAFQRKLGHQHSDTLRVLSNLALAIQAQGRYKNAQDMHQRVLQGRRAVLGERHPDTLASLHSMALGLQRQGKASSAEELNRLALGGYQKELGEHHPDTLSSMNNLGVIYRERSEYQEAEKLWRLAFFGLRDKLGARHPKTLISLGNLVSVLQDQGKHAEAAELLSHSK